MATKKTRMKETKIECEGSDEQTSSIVKTGE